WEYAARAGSKSAYHFGDDAEKLNEYAWHFGNSMNDDLGEPISQQVATKKSNRFGLYDMHGNVAELVLDQYVEDHYAKLAAKDEKPIPADQAIAWPTEEYPRVVRGGSFDDEAADLRTARRRATDSNLKMQDPQLPSSIWWYTDGLHIGFRIVRPIGEPPTDAMQKKWWEPDNIIDQEVLDRQRKSGR
ncbi:MAG: SUMF1/EgtB/PvdO family nonheme iron enzyme, partial [Firmicutes bacterium]|nr:SUMF1/EgtB/PvdO family nonheme iron enzyme [Bacillota bacterium]